MKVSLSRMLNRWLGDTSGQMFCTTTHIRSHTHGGLWVWLEFVLNRLIFWHISHCARCYRWEISNEKKEETAA